MCRRRTWSKRNRRGERGQEMLEFTLVTWLILIPMFLGMISIGMNLIRSNQVTFVAGDIGTMYIQGQDFSTYPMQNLAAREGSGLNFVVGSSFTGNNATNTGNTTGSVIVTLTEMMYIGTTAQATCAAVAPATCTNANSFVYRQRIQFGNGSLATAPPSIAGTPSASIAISSTGVVANYITDVNAQLPSTADSAMDGVWNPGTANGLVDGQLVYLVEMYFESTGFSFGTGTKGVYAKFFY
jgi:hypothetical protein